MAHNEVDLSLIINKWHKQKVSSYVNNEDNCVGKVAVQDAVLSE